MKIKKYFAIAIPVLALLTGGCSDVLDPKPEAILDMEEIVKNPSFAEGFLIKAYKGISNNYDFASDFASDDAITNDDASNIKSIVNGGWAADNNPLSKWNAYFEKISYINTFIQEMDGVEWSWESSYQDELFAQKLKGEAYALRAWYNFQLFKLHAGEGESGALLGLPIVDEVIGTTDNYKIPRAGVDAFVQYMLDDCEIAISNLPSKWENGVYPDEDLTDTQKSEYDHVMGKRNINRMSGISAKLLKSYILLYAASPAYSTGTYTMQMAAEAAAEVMDDNGGLGVLSGGDIDFYKYDYVKNNESGEPEVLWYTSRQDNQDAWEKSHFPPSLFGQGRLNPTQNLVDAFPMIDGTLFDWNNAAHANAPYANRDPRLSAYILYNGATYKGTTINTYVGSGDDEPGYDKFSTKTSYYLKKFLNEGVNLDPSSATKGSRICVVARYTEALLNFAEAANAAGGPDASIGGYTAREVINAIRGRAGITSPDYVNGLGASEMTDLIRNERRLELCFEGQRFWDMRRWMLTNKIKESAKGVTISSDQSSFTLFDAEPRQFMDYQVYGPIPLDETLRYDLEQNKGW